MGKGREVIAADFPSWGCGVARLATRPFRCATDVNLLVTIMHRALRIGLFIGTVLGMCACASPQDVAGRSASGAYGAIEAGRTN